MFGHYRIWFACLGLGLAAMPVFAQHSHRLSGPIAVASAPNCGVSVANSGAPYGYFQTQWRAFPTLATLPQPAAASPAPGTPVLLNAPSMPYSVTETSTPVPIVAASNTGPAQSGSRASQDAVPVPHPASVAALAKTGNRPERGFATLRQTPVEAPIVTTSPTPIAAPPIPPAPSSRPSIVDSGIRPVRNEEDVLRPAWPTLPPQKK